jgi:hypothetical protein
MVTICYIADQRNLGMSMKVERSTVDQVKERFDVLKKKKEEKKKEYDIEQKMKEMGEEVKFIPKIFVTSTYQNYAILGGKATRISQRKEKRAKKKA